MIKAVVFQTHAKIKDFLWAHVSILKKEVMSRGAGTTNVQSANELIQKSAGESQERCLAHVSWPILCCLWGSFQETRGPALGFLY